MTNTEKVLEEFEERLKEFVPTNTEQDIYLLAEDFRAFLSTSIEQALAEERERVVVSWDIADGGTEWVVQFWKVDKDGTKTLFQQLDKNSDDGGSFDLLSSLDKPDKE